MFDKLFLHTVVLLGVSWFTISNGDELLNSNETEAQQFALETSDKMFKFFDKTRDDMFKEYDPNSFFAFFDQKQYIFDESMLLVDIVHKAKQFDFMNFKNKDLKYAFEKITKIADEKIIGGEQYYDIINSLDKLRDSYLYQSYFYVAPCDFCIDFGIPRWAVPHVIAESNDLEEIQFFWNEVRETSGKWAKDNWNLTLEGLKDSANLSDVSPLEFWLREYNLTEIENLMNEIQPLYKELHAFIRNGLLKKYNESALKSDGLIPHHLFEQVMFQTWTNESIIEKMFPLKNLPSAQFVPEERVKTMGFADLFYQKLGFTEFPSNVWKDHIKMKKGELEPREVVYGCSSDIYYKSPNVHLEFCEEMNFKQFIEGYSDMGKLYYATEMAGLPAYFFSTYDLEHAIGKAAMLSASTHSNLKAIGTILEFNNTNDVEMNRLLRKSMQSLLNLPVEFVHIKLMADLLAGTVKREELNNRYWELMDKYVGVEPPNEHNSGPDVLHMPAEFFYDGNENKQSRKFFSEVLSYQIYKKLCELSGKYPKEPLHLCDIFGAKAAGDALKNMMRLGSSKPLNEVLATMFPENPTASAEGILEYYSPVKNFLVKKNSEANVKPGWKHSDEDSTEKSTSEKL